MATATTTERPVLRLDTDPRQAFAWVSQGMIEPEIYLAWQEDCTKAREKVATVKAAKGCSFTAEEFTAKAKEWGVDFGDNQIIKAKPRTFKTGSFGWYLSGKVNVVVDGVPVRVQVSGSYIVIGSKPKGAADDGDEAAE